MSVTDSTPNFRARAAALGLEGTVLDLVIASGVDTLAKYAFCSAYVPGQPDEAPFKVAVKDMLKQEATVGELAVLRRLSHEAYSMTAAELRQSVDRSEDAPAKKLAQPERADRLKRQQARLPGLKIEGTLEPADRLVDLLVQQYEENRVAHVELSRCISKEQEVLSATSKEDRHLTIDSSGTVRIKGKDVKLEADVSSDLLLTYALTRRGLACEQANLLAFSNHDAWAERLMRARLEPPPPGYSPISQSQIITADRKLWVKLAEMTRSGIQTTAAGRPLDLVWDKACDHPDVLHLLAAATVPVFKGGKGDGKSEGKGGFRFRESPYGKGEKGNKGSGKKGGGANFVPRALEGGVGCTPQGHCLCFGFNLGTCRERVERQRCSKGLHLCCYPGCFRAHPFTDCPKRAAAMAKAAPRE